MEQTDSQKPKTKRCKLRLFNIKDSHNLVNFIHKIPNLQQINFKLSQEECEVVGENESLVVIGRSGTGKTTCALMRLFAIQMMFKNSIAREQFIQKDKESKYIFTSRLMDSIHGIKNIFITASPYLILDIRKKYEQLKGHLKQYLDLKELKMMKANGNKIKNNQQIQEKQQNFGLKKVQNIDRQIKERQEGFNSFQKLKDSDYPGFFSLQEFLIMIDGSLEDSFFLRDVNSKRIKGSFKPRRKQFKIKLNKNEILASQCNWKIFSEQFWSKIDHKSIIKRLNYNNIVHRPITDIAVWTEIISTIKGSYESHLYQKGYLPISQYFKNSKNSFLGDFQKKCIYQIFLYYEEWKSINAIKYYDIMDLSNHILRQVYKYLNSYDESISQNKVPIEFNHLFLDEVQDLPPVIAYLISLLFTDGLYYAGDIAQGIQKGVTFNFSDLTSMFQKDFPLQKIQLNQPKKHILTANFRTHHNVLNLANSIIKMLRKIFPLAVDDLQEQISPVLGPMPVYLKYHEVDEEIIEYLLDVQDQQNDKKQKGCNSVVIIREEQDLLKLPAVLKDMDCLKLTIIQAKGQQFNDVIMFNFFDQRLKHLWKILKYTSLFPQRGTYQFNRRDVDKSDFQEIISQLKMLYTVVTRTKCTFIMLEQHLPEQIQAIWQNLHLIATENDIDQVKQQRRKYIQVQNSSSSKNQMTWEERGYLFYLRKQYKLALQCYRKEGIEEMCLKLQAIIYQMEGEQMLNTLEERYSINKQIFMSIQDQQAFLESNQYVNYRRECSLLTDNLLIQAAQRYLQIGQVFNAGYCLYHAFQFEKTIVYLAPMQNEECYYFLGNSYKRIRLFQKAAIEFKKCKRYQDMISCCETQMKFKQCMQLLQQCNDFIYQEYYVRKYLRIFINKQKIISESLNNFNNTYLQISNQQQPYSYLDHYLDLNNDGTFVNSPKFWIKFQEQLNQIDRIIDFLPKILVKVIQNLYEAEMNHIRVNKLTDKQILNQIERAQKGIFDYYKSYIFQNQPIIIEEIILFEIDVYQNKKKLEKNRNWFCYSYESIEFSKQIEEKINQIIKLFTNLNTFLEKKLQLIQNRYQHNIKINSIQSRQLMELVRNKNMQYLVVQRLINCLPTKGYSKLPKNLRNIKFQIIQLYVNRDYIIGLDTQFNLLKEIYISIKESFCRYFQQIIDQQFAKFNIQRKDRLQIIEKHHSPFLHYSESQINKQFIHIWSQYGAYFFKLTLFTSNTLPEQNKDQFKRKTFAIPSYQQIVTDNLDQAPLSQSQYYHIKLIQIQCPTVLICLRVPQLSLRGLIGYYAMHSRNYLTCSQTNIKQPRHKERCIKHQYMQINPLFFNFKLNRTRLRYQDASNELLQALILFGSHEYIYPLLPIEVQLQLDYIFMDKQRAISQYRKYITNDNFNSNTISKFTEQYKKLQLMNQFIQMDQFQQNSWYQYHNQSGQISHWQMQEAQKLTLLHIDGKARMLQSQIYSKYSKYRKEKTYQYNQLLINLQNIIDEYYGLWQKRYEYKKIQRQNVRFDNFNQNCRIFQNCINAWDKISQRYQQQIRKNAKDYQFWMFPKQQNINQSIQHFIDLINGLEKPNIQKHAKMEKNIIDLRKQIGKIQKKLGSNKIINKQLKISQQYDQIIQIYNNNFSKTNITITINLIQQILSLQKQEQQIKSKAIYIPIQISQFLDNYLKIIQPINNSIQKYSQKQIAIQFMIKQMKALKEFINKLRQKQKQLRQQFKQRKKKIYKIYMNQELVRLKYKKFIKSNKQANQILYYICCSDNFIQIMNHLNELFRQPLPQCNINIAKILLLYLSIRKLQKFKQMQEQQEKLMINNPSKSQKWIESRQIFDKKFKTIQYMLSHPLQNHENFRLLCVLLQIFKVKLICNSKFTTVFQCMTLVHISSPLIKSFNKEQFCYYADQNQTCLLMKLSTISTILFKHFKIQATIQQRDSLRVFLLTSKKKYDFKSQTIHDQFSFKAMAEQIQANKYKLIYFFGSNAFLSHQSSQFVYNQLKEYYDLILMIRSGQAHGKIEKQIRRRIRELEEEFQQWQEYAKKFQIKKK